MRSDLPTLYHSILFLSDLDDSRDATGLWLGAGIPFPCLSPRAYAADLTSLVGQLCSVLYNPVTLLTYVVYICHKPRVEP